jgi:uncharacterized protein YegJ (DUF2314 family)
MSSQTDPPSIKVQAGDPEMDAAMQTARDKFPEFWREVSTDHKRVIPVLEGSMVKAYFFDEGAPLTGEHMWVRDIEYDGQTISGVLVDTSIQLHSVRPGQHVSFPLMRLSDWLYVENGRAYGVFTVKLLRTRMTDDERKSHDSHYPFRFD